MAVTELDLTVGALLIGTFISTALYGVVVLQSYTYCTGESQDPLWLRILVWVVLLLETAHAILTWVLIYDMTVTQYGHPTAIVKDSVALAVVFPLSALVGSLVQSFFAYRVLKLSNCYTIPVILWCGAVLRTSFSLVLGIIPLRYETIQEFTTRFVWIVVTPLAVNVSVDILNAASLSHYLLKDRPRFSSTKKLIDTLVVYTIETGIVTSIFGMVILIMAVSMRKSFIDIGLFVPYPTLFSISLLTSLNVRGRLHRSKTSVLSHQLWMTAGSWSGQNSGNNNQFMDIHAQPVDMVLVSPTTKPGSSIMKNPDPTLSVLTMHTR